MRAEQATLQARQTAQRRRELNVGLTIYPASTAVATVLMVTGLTEHFNRIQNSDVV